MAKHLSPSERKEALKTLPGWKESEDGKSLLKTYTFSSFAQAFSFMTLVAFYIEKVGHHPDWTNVYNTVHVRLTTHARSGVSAKDIALALHMDNVAFSFLNPCMSDQSDQVF